MTDLSSGLEGEVCVITGGGGGIGRAMAARFAAAGMRIVIGDIEQESLSASVEVLGNDPAHVLGVRCDTRSIDDMHQLRERAVEQFGDVHIVCLNAGVAPTGTLLDTPLDVFDWVIDVNVRGVMNGIHAFGPLLVEREHGHVVCTASAAGLTDTPTVGAYGASKHAVIGLAAALRHELAPAGVGVSVLCPGLVDTRIFESERNRPAGMPDPSIDNATTKQYRDLLAAAGAAPSTVAEYVHRAVLDNQFFVFPTADFDTGFEGRIELIRQGIAWRSSKRTDAEPSAGP